MMMGAVSFEQKKLFVTQNLRILGVTGTGIKIVVESAIFGINDPDLPLHYAVIFRQF